MTTECTWINLDGCDIECEKNIHYDMLTGTLRHDLYKWAWDNKANDYTYVCREKEKKYKFPQLFNDKINESIYAAKSSAIWIALIVLNSKKKMEREMRNTRNFFFMPRVFFKSTQGRSKRHWGETWWPLFFCLVFTFWISGANDAQ